MTIMISRKSDLFEPLICLLVEVDLAGGGEILGGLSKVAEESLSAASPLVGSRVVRVELDGSGAVLHTGIGGLRGDLEVAHPPLGEHHGRVGVDLDGFSEQSDGFFPLTLYEANQ